MAPRLTFYGPHQIQHPEVMDATLPQNEKRKAPNDIGFGPALKKIREAAANGMGYSSIRAIIITFEDHDFDETAFDEEISSVVDLFEIHLGAEKCTRVKIPRIQSGSISREYVTERIEEFKRLSAAKPDTGLELYYFAGHGSLATDGTLKTGSKVRGGQWFNWSYLQRHVIFNDDRNDVLVFLDCCSGGQIATKPDTIGRKEVFAACSTTGETAVPGKASFTSFFVGAARSFREPFTVSELREKTSTSALRHGGEAPVHQSSGHSTSPIVLIPRGCPAWDRRLLAAKKKARRVATDKLRERIFQINEILEVIWELRSLNEDDFPGSDEVSQMEADPAMVEPLTQVGVYRAFRRIKDREVESGLSGAMPIVSTFNTSNNPPKLRFLQSRPKE